MATESSVPTSLAHATSQPLQHAADTNITQKAGESASTDTAGASTNGGSAVPSKATVEGASITSPDAPGLGDTGPSTEPQAAESNAKEAQTGVKRGIETSPPSAPVPVSQDAAQGMNEQVEPDAKKPKTKAESTTSTSASAIGATNGAPKKAGRPKKDKVKDTLKKVVPGDGIGSRTRSRTKAT